MAITKTAAGNYRVEVFYPKEVRSILKVKQTRYRKTCNTLREAHQAERDIQFKIDSVQRTGKGHLYETKGQITFEDFFKTVFWQMYVSGSTGRTRTVPTKATQINTLNLFNNHLIPMFGQYTLAELNEDKDFVVRELVTFSQTYANIRTVKSYVRQMFETAEVLDYIEYDRLEKPLRFINSPKKDRLKKRREAEGESLTAQELLEWLDAAFEDYKNGKLNLQDYLLFMLTLHLGDRKSESYALKWRNVDLEEGKIYITRALDRYGEEKSTKGRKLSEMTLPKELVPLLIEWKEQQKEELKYFNIRQNNSQLLFSYTNTHGGVNQPLHSDYLNYRIKSIKHRHPELAPLHPHKLRHTFSTLARQGGATMEQISESLTHSDVKTTRIYVNTPDIINPEVHRMFVNRLKKERLKKT